MFASRIAAIIVATSIGMCACTVARADELRNIKPGQQVPAFKLPTIDDTMLDSETTKGNVLVLVYLSAEQRSSELAATESQIACAALPADQVKLVHVTADAINKSHFQKHRAEHHITAVLGFDADRSLYHQLGLIVFPTTIVVDKEGKLSHVISLRGPEYSRTLDAYVRHALGTMTEEQMHEALKSHAQANASPRSLATAHRATARQMREKGRLDAAKEELEKARGLDASDHEVLVDLADVDLSLGRVDEAEAVIKELLKVQPEHRRARQIEGICLYRHGQLAEAETVLLEALKLNPEPGRVHYYLGRIYEQQGQTAKALEQYREALRRELREPEIIPPPENK